MHDSQVTEDGRIAFHDHMPTYWRVIITLAVLTGVEFGISFAMHGTHESSPTLFMLGVLALVALAAVKAVLVAKFFMHLKYDPKILAFLCMTPVVLGTPLVLFCVYDGIMGPGFK